MKKFASLVLSVVILATMLCVFTVPASAYYEEQIDDYTVPAGQTLCVVKRRTNGNLTVNGELLVKSKGIIIADEICVNSTGKLTLEPGATIVTKELTLSCKNTVIPAGTTVIAESTVYLKQNAELLLESGAKLKSPRINGDNGTKLTVSAGATVLTEKLECPTDLYGVLKLPEGVTGFGFSAYYPQIHDGALLDVTFGVQTEAQDFAEALGLTADGNRVYFHQHKFNTCLNCGEEEESTLLGSTLSEGSLTIIVGVAAAVVFGLGGFFVGKAAGKKKKTAVAEGENKDEE